jgi:[ribosomal protein S5]-alanine N-acetyltransferase
MNYKANVGQSSLGRSNMTRSTNIPFIQGKGFYMREVRLSDIEGNWYQWLNDEVVTKFQNKGIIPNTREKQRAYLEAITTSDTDVVLALVDDSSERHFGNIGLHEIDPIHRSAKIGIVIGEKQFQGKGYGKQAWNLITEYGLKRLNLHRLYAHIIKDNVPCLRAAQASGFKIEGEMRDVFFKQGKYHNVLYLNLLKGDFNKIGVNECVVE